MIIYDYFLCDLLIECSGQHIFVYCFPYSWSCCLAQAGLELMTPPLHPLSTAFWVCTTIPAFISQRADSEKEEDSMVATPMD